MIYRFKASLSNSKIFMREYEIPSDWTLYKVHEYLMGEFGFSKDQMVLFRGCDGKGREKSDYGLFDMGDGAMDAVTLESAVAKNETVLEYVFDLFKNRFISLVFEGESEPQPRVYYPRLTAEKGRAPEQFIKGNADDYDKYESSLGMGGPQPDSASPSKFDEDDELEDEDDEIFDEGEFEDDEEK